MAEELGFYKLKTYTNEYFPFCCQLQVFSNNEICIKDEYIYSFEALKLWIDFYKAQGYEPYKMM